MAASTPVRSDRENSYSCFSREDSHSSNLLGWGQKLLQEAKEFFFSSPPRQSQPSYTTRPDVPGGDSTQYESIIVIPKVGQIAKVLDPVTRAPIVQPQIIIGPRIVLSLPSPAAPSTGPLQIPTAKQTPNDQSSDSHRYIPFSLEAGELSYRIDSQGELTYDFENSDS